MAEMTSTANRTWILGLASAASFMAVLDSQVVATALSTIRVDLHASLEALEWTVNAYNLSFAVLLLTGAALGERLGRRRVFAAGLALFTAASAGCALATSPGWLIAARAIQGAGGALVMPLAMALLSAAFPPQERGKALGIFGGLTGVALIVGPMAGGAIAEGIAWRWIFWINVPLGLLIIPLVLRIAAISAPEVAYSQLIAPLIVAGAGVSAAMPAAQNAVMSSVAGPEIGTASGIFNMFRFLGGVAGIATLAAVFSALGGVQSPAAFCDGFAPAMAVAAALSLLAAIAGMWQPARRPAALTAARALDQS